MINSENRNQILDDYVNRVLDQMDSSTLMQLAFDLLRENKDQYTNEELETEIREYYPDIIGEDE
jgi:hypothetical protein